MSSVSSGATVEVAFVVNTDITLDVYVCCRPSACPISCTMVRKKALK